MSEQWDGHIGEVLVYSADRGVTWTKKRQWWRPWHTKTVMEWKPVTRSAAAQQWIVETYLADKWGVDLYPLVQPDPEKQPTLGKRDPHPRLSRLARWLDGYGNPVADRAWQFVMWLDRILP